MMMVTVMMMIIVIMVIIMILIIWMRKMGKLRTTCWVPAGITTKEGGEGAKTPSNMIMMSLSLPEHLHT